MKFQYSSLISSLKPKMIVSNTCLIRSGKMGINAAGVGLQKAIRVKPVFHLRCRACHYDESVTANTVFHKLKIPLLKAFGMSFRIAVKKKGMSTTALAREFSINQKSSWLFKRKAQESMKSSGNYPLDGKVEVDELLIGGPEKDKRGRNKGEKKLVVISPVGTISVFRNISDGSNLAFAGDVAFDQKTDFAANQPLSIFLDDLDGDGKPDIVVSNHPSTVSVFKSTSSSGTVSFDVKFDCATGTAPVSVVIADLNGDKKPDIITANFFDATVSVLKNTSAGDSIIFAAKTDYITGNGQRGISTGDIDGDAKPDIIAANFNDNTISVLRNNTGFQPGQLCPGGNAVFASNITGNTYQWQQDMWEGFVNVTDNDIFSGTNSNTLQLTGPPSSWYGVQYRSVVDGNYSDTIKLVFVNNWLGTIDSTWENAGNWSCNQLPDANTDVVISCMADVTLHSNGICRSLRSTAGSSVQIDAGFTLTITR